MARNFLLILLDLQGSTAKFLPEFPKLKSFSFCTYANPPHKSFRMRSYKKGGRGVSASRSGNVQRHRAFTILPR